MFSVLFLKNKNFPNRTVKYTVISLLFHCPTSVHVSNVVGHSSNFTKSDHGAPSQVYCHITVISLPNLSPCVKCRRAFQ